MRYGGEWVRRLDHAEHGAHARHARSVGVVVALAILFIALQHASVSRVLARRPQVEIMSRLGATDRFIATPFVLEAMFEAALAAFPSLAICFGLQAGPVDAQSSGCSSSRSHWLLRVRGRDDRLLLDRGLLALSRVVRAVGAMRRGAALARAAAVRCCWRARAAPPRQDLPTVWPAPSGASWKRFSSRLEEKREAASRLKGQETQGHDPAPPHRAPLEPHAPPAQRAQRRRREHLDAQLGVTRMDLQRSLNLLRDQRQKLGRRLRAMYKYGPARELEFLLSTESFGQLLARWDYLVMVARAGSPCCSRASATGRKWWRRWSSASSCNITQVQKTAKQTTGENQRLAAQAEAKQSTVHQIQTQREAYEAAAAELERTAQLDQAAAGPASSRKRRSRRTPATSRAARARSTGRCAAMCVGHFGQERNPRFPQRRHAQQRHRHQRRDRHAGALGGQGPRGLHHQRTTAPTGR